jgi:hypothetical protein
MAITSARDRCPKLGVFVLLREPEAPRYDGGQCPGMPLMAQTDRVAWSAGCRSFSSLVVVVSELVGYVVGPIELAKGEGRRHEQV